METKVFTDLRPTFVLKYYVKALLCCRLITCLSTTKTFSWPVCCFVFVTTVTLMVSNMTIFLGNCSIQLFPIPMRIIKSRSYRESNSRPSALKSKLCTNELHKNSMVANIYVGVRVVPVSTTVYNETEKNLISLTARLEHTTSELNW